MTLNKFNKKLLGIFDSVNHHTVDIYDLTLINVQKQYPKVINSISKIDITIGVHENSLWGETLFDITWSEHFLKLMKEEYPESLI